MVRVATQQPLQSICLLQECDALCVLASCASGQRADKEMKNKQDTACVLPLSSFWAPTSRPSSVSNNHRLYHTIPLLLFPEHRVPDANLLQRVGVAGSTSAIWAAIS